MKFLGQLSFLLVMTGLALIVVSVVMGLAVFAAATMGGSQTAGLHLGMWGQNLLLMIGVPLLWTWWTSVRHNPAYTSAWKGIFHILRMDRVTGKFLILTLVLMVVSLPASDALDVLSLHFPWPDAVRHYCEESFINNQKILMVLLQPTGILGYLELFLLMCLSTAIGEEMMFRGAVLNCLRQGGRMNWHLAIWIVGLIFSLIHFEMMGFLSRWLLGALLAYLVYWSRSLWPAILAHCLNNLVALIGYKMSTVEELMTLDRDCSFSPWVVCVSVLLTIVVLGYLWRIRVSDDE